MKKTLILAFLAVMVVSCSKNPQARFAEVCAKEQDASRRASCLCTSEELAKQLDKGKYEKFVTAMEEAQNAEGAINFSAVLKNDDLDKETITAFISAAKKCGPAR